jgi:heme/copper-type cytochrome/quinol oxidase subunit 4
MDDSRNTKSRGPEQKVGVYESTKSGKGLSTSAIIAAVVIALIIILLIWWFMTGTNGA